MLRHDTVPSGVTAMQALAGRADVDTSYGGRFVQSIDGVAGDADARRDWFYFVNGIEADRGAADYRVRPGDVDLVGLPLLGRAMRCESRSSSARFPEPFLHGYDGHRPTGGRPLRGRTRCAGVRSVSRSRRRGRSSSLGRSGGGDANLLVVNDAATFTAELARRRRGRLARRLRISFEDAKRLLADPGVGPHRYEGLGVRPAAAAALLAASAAAALLADRWQVSLAIAAALLGLCLRAPAYAAAAVPRRLLPHVSRRPPDHAARRCRRGGRPVERAGRAGARTARRHD